MVMETPMQMPDFVASWMKDPIPFSPYSPWSFCDGDGPGVGGDGYGGDGDSDCAG